MKYRVKFQCYWYNTGAGDNHHYDNFEDFDELEEAKAFRDKVNEQLEMSRKYEYRKITYEEYSRWEENFELVEVENGFISDFAKIFEYYPEVEKQLND